MEDQTSRYATPEPVPVPPAEQRSPGSPSPPEQRSPGSPSPPEQPSPASSSPPPAPPVQPVSTPPPEPQPTWRPPPADRGRTASMVFGVIVLLVGLWFFAGQTLGLDLPDVEWSQLWPLLLIGLGAWIVIGAMRRNG